jgi:hypothetical protein
MRTLVLHQETVERALTELAFLRAELDAVREAIGLSPFSSEPLSAFITRALALDTAYPVREVLEQLADAADHLLGTHSCDAHGYEGVGLARDSARRIVAVLGGTDPEKPAVQP